MAPTPSPIPVQSPISSSRHFYHLHRQALGFSRHPPAQPSAARAQQHKPRMPDAVDGSYPSVALTPEPPQIGPWSPSESLMIAPEPSALPVISQPQAPSQPGDLPGNIVAAVAVIVLILGGLIGLVIGGEMLRRQARKPSKRVSPPHSSLFGTWKSKSVKNAAEAPQQPIKTSPEKFPYDEKTLTPLTRPLPVLKRERTRRLSGIWPIRSLSRHPPPVTSPQTTWSEFTPVSLYVTSPRTVLDRIPEECEDCESEASVSRASFQSDSVILTPCLEIFDGQESLGTGERRCGQDRRDICRGGRKDEDSKSLGSSAPDMTSDEDESSRSSMISLESLEDGNDQESLKEVFELRRAQTTSMQMNKGVLLSLSLKTLDESQNSESTDEGPSRSSSPGPGGKDRKDYVTVERELSLAILGGSFSAMSLDEFPSPPSMLPVIPSFVSGF
ncbi:hypothetical protein JVU11DRAFT_2730 [Chiua virens]|nr:hypothetical protein JVU11DRAFT_2730 [Chiua virens]